MTDCFRLWQQARTTYAESHDWSPLDRLRDESDVRAALGRHRLLPWGRTPEQLEVVADELAARYGRRPKIFHHVRPARDNAFRRFRQRDAKRPRLPEG